MLNVETKGIKTSQFLSCAISFDDISIKYKRVSYFQDSCHPNYCILKIYRLYLLLTISLIYITAFSQPITAPLADRIDVPEDQRVENFRGKSILVLTPHPDDETFAMGGTLSKLSANGNTINIVIFTNDNKGSLDLEMTRERLARIRRAEEEKSAEILGISKENLFWLGYEDGDLEYADPKVLRGEIARYIKLFKPDAVFTPDPGNVDVQWHKTDHRMAANISQDAFIAAEWHLYYPQHYLDEGLVPFNVPQIYYYYSQRPNYEISISRNEFELKMKASAAHVSQFEPSVTKYQADMPQEVFEGITKRFLNLNSDDKGGLSERFRRSPE